MSGRERFQRLIRDRAADRTGFWMGNPHPDTLPGYLKYFGADDQFDLAVKLGDDFHWVAADHAGWRPPDGSPIFDVLGGKARHSLNQDGAFAECEDVAEVDAFRWPDPRHIDLDVVERLVDQSIEGGMAVAGGTWSCFFHNVADFFGMENYFVKMYTDPAVVDAVTEHVVDFYLAANERVYKRMAKKLDAFFLGNDFGTQLDLLISPEGFRRFVLPSFRKLIDQAKQYGLPVILHSCGAIDKAIPDLIDAGIDALHPLQALARGMDAENLRKYKNDILFVGGVDTQQLLVHGSPDDVKAEVRRIRKLLGAGWVASPSHEALLPNVRPENLLALRDAAIQS
ncbi:MAG: hypothetical protein GX558_01185 [Clostridiales bacterium]|nr:hypothetical protein [Clostridiales bacterium]